jgi:hypothetical protein
MGRKPAGIDNKGSELPILAIRVKSDIKEPRQRLATKMYSNNTPDWMVTGNNTQETTLKPQT